MDKAKVFSTKTAGVKLRSPKLHDGLLRPTSNHEEDSGRENHEEAIVERKSPNKNDRGCLHRQGAFAGDSGETPTKRAKVSIRTISHET